MKYNTTAAEAKLRQQYDEALDFLNQLNLSAITASWRRNTVNFIGKRV